MPTNHPPRPCFAALVFDDTTQTVLATFTDRLIQYRFTFPSPTDYAAFKAAQTGVYFNSSVRNSGVMTFERLP
jgi:hypothetical protein